MGTSVITRRWATVVTAATTPATELRRSLAAAQLPLISRTGFELRHIVTSQIGSL